MLEVLVILGFIDLIEFQFCVNSIKVSYFD